MKQAGGAAGITYGYAASFRPVGWLVINCAGWSAIKNATGGNVAITGFGGAHFAAPKLDYKCDQ